MVCKILAKSPTSSNINGISLIDHSRYVSTKSLEILKSLGFDSVYKKHEDIVKISSLLHDIGKCTELFQKMLNNKKGENKNKYLHNEIGWAFVTHYLKHKDVKKIASNIYWHHGINNEMCVDDSIKILDSITVEDIYVMKEFLISILGGDSYLKTYDVDDSQNTPSYYIYVENRSMQEHRDSSENLDFFIQRTCLISADRIVSSEKDIELKSLTKKSKNIDIDTVDKTVYDINRLQQQLNIVNNDIVENTTIIKAPAGFGKTLLGLFWNFKSDKKLIWVCPRNMIAQSVYESIKAELSNMKIDLNIELYLTNEVKDSNHGSKGFDSDIIITNIDSYLKPCVNNGVSDKLFFINSCDVIFDEYHELVSDEAMFACFVNIMTVRHNFTTSKTLLLSATPSTMNYLWDKNGKETSILPNKTEHYKPAHDKKYNFSISTISNIIDIKNHIVDNSSSLLLVNSISNSQKMKFCLNAKYLIHSEFETNRKIVLFKGLIDLYGKKTKRLDNKENVVATHVLQASLDVSFKNLLEIVLSPEGTLQRIGRDNRWGDYLESSIKCFVVDDESEKCTINVLYDKELNSLWVLELKKINNVEIGLEEFYVIYNQFNITHFDKIKSYLNKKMYDKLGSLRKLSYICPNKYNKKEIDDDIICSGGNKLRSSDKTCFIIAKKYKSNEYCEPFSVIVRNGFKEFDGENEEDARVRINQFIRINQDIRFNYSTLIGKPSNYKKFGISLSVLRKNSNKSNTPYPIDNKVYHEDFGLIKVSNLKEYNL
jgi:CRISPR-associated endonuclease/helicase Cas3